MLVLRVITFVIAWRIVVPAFSMSFRDIADVIQTLSAGWHSQVTSLALMAWLKGRILSLVIRTPLVRAFTHVSLVLGCLLA